VFYETMTLLMTFGLNHLKSRLFLNCIFFHICDTGEARVFKFSKLAECSKY